MGHIVFISYGITSYLNTSFAVAAGLKARGHRVTYVSSLDVETAVAAQGFDFMLLRDEASVRQDPEAFELDSLPGKQRYRRRNALIRVGQRKRDYYLHSDEWARMLETLRPDVVCIDEELPEAIVWFARQDVPLLLMQYLGGTRYRRAVPPTDSHAIPDGSVRSRLKIQAEWLKLWTKRGLTHLLAPLFYAGTDRRSIIRALAAQTGFDYRGAAFHNWFPMTFPDIPTLVFAAPEFDFAPPPTMNGEAGAFVGPMVWCDRVDTIDEETNKKVEAFLQRNATRQRPLIYCSLGTFWQMNVDYLQRVVEAFRQRPEWDLVLASGRGTVASDFEPIPENVLICQRVPQLRLLAQANGVLTHGGIGTINECITFGVPVLVYSTGQVDQNGNAARVEYHGLGRRGAIDESAPQAIANQIAEVLNNPNYRTRVTQMQAIYRTYQSENRAVGLIEAELAQSRTVQSVSETATRFSRQTLFSRQHRDR